MSYVAYSQEVRFIDMTVEKARTELRHPPSPPPVCEEGKSCIAGGWGGGGIAHGAPDHHDPHALALYVLSLQERIDCAQEVTAEFRLLNSGVAPIDIPVSLHLSDLQPTNESETFDYESIDLAVRERATDRVGVHGALTLYGSPKHEGTMLTLQPGEWIRVRGHLAWHFTPARSGKSILDPVAALRTTTYVPHPGGSSTAIRNRYPNITPTLPRDVEFVVNGNATKTETP